MIHYFAYGSNLHPLRLLQRIPSARLTGTVKLQKYRLKFHKTGIDSSAKCNLIGTENTTDCIYGAIYEMATEQQIILDKFESKGSGYLDHEIKIQYQNQQLNCLTYLAQPAYIDNNIKPYHWYKQLVILGAKYLQFPTVYISSIINIESCNDPDKSRTLDNEILIQKISNFPKNAES